MSSKSKLEEHQDNCEFCKGIKPWLEDGDFLKVMNHLEDMGDE